jgi:hypothetical protein
VNVYRVVPRRRANGVTVDPRYRASSRAYGELRDGIGCRYAKVPVLQGMMEFL